MSIEEVYALNIQDSQIKKVLSKDKHTSEGIEQERKNFLYWLQNEHKNGFKFSDQLSAWEYYTLPYDFDFWEEEEIEELVWLEEITEIFENQAGTRVAKEWDSNLNYLLV